jgi:hypothetical protein
LGYQAFSGVAPTEEGSDSERLYRAVMFMGYVDGISQMLQMTRMICPPAEMTLDDVFDAVGNALRAHPDQHERAAVVWVSVALQAEYPCED